MLAYDENEYVTGNGIFFNPVRNTDSISNTLPGLASLEWGTNAQNASDDVPNSIGNVIYYDRSTG